MSNKGKCFGKNEKKMFLRMKTARWIAKLSR